MPRQTKIYKCNGCGVEYPKWVGRCNRCGEFGTVDETSGSHTASKSVGLKGTLNVGQVAKSATRVNDIVYEKKTRNLTGLIEFDRVIGGGLVAGQVILLAGEPGAGKSTLLLSISDHLARSGLTVLIVSGEESVEQIGVRAKRMSIDDRNIFIADENDLSMVLGHIEEVNPDFLVIDSVQTIASPDVEGRAGSVSQVQEVASALTRVAKSKKIPCAIVAQITKEGSIAGPKTLEHLVDTVLFFEGDRHTSLRILRVLKNRYGSADEIACFEQSDDGIHQVLDPSGLFLGERETPVEGTCLTVTQEGRRPLLAEVQALVSYTNAPNPRRGVSGLDNARMAMLVAVTEKHGKLKLYDKDTFLATVGGIKITEPGIDLAVCLALVSAAKDIPIPPNIAALGEVALSGDVRPCTSIQQRIFEASRLGVTKIFVPRGTARPKTLNDGTILIPVDHVRKAIQAVNAMQ